MHETRVLTKQLLQEEVLVMDFVLNDTQHSLETYWVRLSMMSWIIKTEVCLCYLPRLSASADNTDARFW